MEQLGRRDVRPAAVVDFLSDRTGSSMSISRPWRRATEDGTVSRLSGGAFGSIAGRRTRRFAAQYFHQLLCSCCERPVLSVN
jgi:hypothetical protein